MLKFYLKYKSLYSKSGHVVCLNTFTLHFPSENVLHSTRSSLKWNLIWNEVFSETHGRLRTFQRHGWLWIHSLLIFRSKTFSRVPNLLSNEVFSETRGRLWTVCSTDLRLSGSTWIFWTLQRRDRLQTVRPAFDFPDWNFFSLWTVWPAFYFPDWPEFF